jgi:ankyrin repeat protein
LENGLDFNVKMRKGITPLEVAQENKDRIVNFLIEKGAK